MKRYTWQWKASDAVANKKELLKFCKVNQVQVIYLQLSNSVTDTDYLSFNREANLCGIQVHAAAGEKEWALVENRQHIQKFIDRVFLINASAKPEEAFTGIHFDIEPHTFSNWSTDKDTIVKNWIQNVDWYVNDIRISKASNMEISAALQFSLDTIQTGNPDYPTLDRYMIAKHDKIAIMAYRNRVEGQDSIISISQTKLDHAEEMRKPDSVIIGVEICPSKEGEKITFAHKGRNAMLQSLQFLDFQLSGYKSYAGHAIHSLSCWMNSKV